MGLLSMERGGNKQRPGQPEQAPDVAEADPLPARRGNRFHGLCLLALRCRFFPQDSISTQVRCEKRTPTKVFVHMQAPVAVCRVYAMTAPQPEPAAYPNLTQYSRSSFIGTILITWNESIERVMNLRAPALQDDSALPAAVRAQASSLWDGVACPDVCRARNVSRNPVVYPSENCVTGCLLDCSRLRIGSTP